MQIESLYAYRESKNTVCTAHKSSMFADSILHTGANKGLSTHMCVSAHRGAWAGAVCV